MYKKTGKESHFKNYHNVNSVLLFERESDKYDPAKFTVAIPTFKRPEWLFEAVKSVANQSIGCDIIIIDNDSSREYSDLIIAHLKEISCNIKYYVNEENIGVYGNWNRCIELSRNEVMTILNDDDYLHSDFIKTVVKYFSKGPMLYTDYDNIQFSNQIDIFLKKNIRNKSIQLKRVAFDDIFWRNPVNGSLGAVFERSKAIDIGGYDPSLYPNSDYYFNMQYWKSYGVVKLNRKLALYRWADNGSFKLDNLIGFYKNDLKFRNILIEEFFTKKSAPYSVMKKISKLLATRSTYNYKKIHSDFPSEIFAKELGVSRLLSPRILASRPVSILLRLALTVLSLFIRKIK